MARENGRGQPSRWRELRQEWPICERGRRRHAQWMPNGKAIGGLQENARATRELGTRPEAKRNYDLNRAAELRLWSDHELGTQMQAAEEQAESKQGKTRLLREVSPRTRSPK